ncbi:hypothetical protein ACYFX5_07640 [Bremerella sp. T1]|uniref:hypothetical protein n=1 Tax=Bremerella sp. TYQ1 TaxID=3119568 RepID=UPI001CCCA7E8|nr:hypothetical protein [Bremerella volcania]UBM38129.1 hypothetical protein LA756_09575 [Bremerella volcania]
MTPYTLDTHPDALEFQLQMFRGMTGEQRASKGIALSGLMVSMAKNAIRRQFPEFTEQEVVLKFIELNYGDDLARSVETRLRSA